MSQELSDYGLWDVALVNSAMFIIFAFSFARPLSARDWRSLGAFSAFLVALFTEMYGFPLTVYLLSGWLGSRYPGVDLFSHDSGHLLGTLLGWDGDPHLTSLHLLSDGLVALGFLIVAAAWRALYRAQRHGEVATSGLYGRVRHPQYVGFIVVMLGFLLQWPTLPTVVMFPILVSMYVRLARREEREALEAFGEEYARYVRTTPAFVPRLSRKLPAKRMQ